MVRLSLLGTVSVDVNGDERCGDRPDRATRVLAWLALHRGLRDRGTVAAQLWPDILDTSARASLRSGLWELRRLLGDAADEVLVATRDQVGLAEGPALRVDVHEASDLASEGRDEEALALSGGELLPGIAEDWADSAREEHARFLAALLGRLADAAAERGDHARAIELARRRNAADPLSEELHRDLLRRLVAAGDRAAALAEHARMRRRLFEELGVGPSPETTALVAELRAPGAADPAQLPTRLRRLEMEAFVGRDPELRGFAAAWRRAVAGGQPQLVLVSGEPGIGKTRLAARFAAIVDRANGAVLYGGAFEDSLAPLEPLTEALGADLEPLTVDGAGGIFEQVERQVEARARGAAALLVLDDMQWADHLTLSLLAHLLRSPAADRLLVLCVYREAELPGSALERLLPTLRRECEVAEIHLAGLDSQELRSLIDGGSPGSASELASVIHRRTGGNPLFARELARVVAMGGPLEEVVPAAVEELIARRTERLADGGDTLAVAAVLGETFSPQVLALVLGHPGTRALDEAVAAMLLEETDAGLRFVHALIRAAVYARLGPARRAELHVRAADALVTARGEDAWPEVVEVARHRLVAAKAGNPALAVETALRAADRAVEIAAYDQAVELYTRALPLVAGDEALRRKLVVRRASAFQLLTHIVIDGPQLVG